MKTKLYVLYGFLLTLLITSCETNGPINQDLPSAGYLEYQYDYKIMVNGTEVTRQGYKRVNISDVAYAQYDSNTLDSVFIKKGFRPVELYFYSKECNPDSINQPLGASYAQASLIDSLGLDTKPNRILDYVYQINRLTNLATYQKPMCLNLAVNMNMMVDTTTHTNRYEYSFTGQLFKYLNIYYAGNNRYQIIAYGLSNSKIYTVYYNGTIRRKKNIAQ